MGAGCLIMIFGFQYILPVCPEILCKLKPTSLTNFEVDGIALVKFWEAYSHNKKTLMYAWRFIDKDRIRDGMLESWWGAARKWKVCFHMPVWERFPGTARNYKSLTRESMDLEGWLANEWKVLCKMSVSLWRYLHTSQRQCRWVAEVIHRKV